MGECFERCSDKNLAEGKFFSTLAFFKNLVLQWATLTNWRVLIDFIYRFTFTFIKIKWCCTYFLDLL